MPRDPNQAQQAFERKQAKREQKQGPKLVQHNVPGWIENAATWGLQEVLLSRNWTDTHSLATALVARRGPAGQIAAASFLVDLACLGVKDSSIRLFRTYSEYEEKMRERMTATQPMMPADPNLVAKILDTAVSYARQFGFEPDPIYDQARTLLADAVAEWSTVAVPTGGPEGKPHFVAGPYDNVERIMRKLTRAAGPGGFNYTIFTDAPPAGLLDE